MLGKSIRLSPDQANQPEKYTFAQAKGIRQAKKGADGTKMPPRRAAKVAGLSQAAQGP